MVLNATFGRWFQLCRYEVLFWNNNNKKVIYIMLKNPWKSNPECFQRSVCRLVGPSVMLLRRLSDYSVGAAHWRLRSSSAFILLQPTSSNLGGFESCYTSHWLFMTRKNARRIKNVWREHMQREREGERQRGSERKREKERERRCVYHSLSHPAC